MQRTYVHILCFTLMEHSGVLLQIGDFTKQNAPLKGLDALSILFQGFTIKSDMSGNSAQKTVTALPAIKTLFTPDVILRYPPLFDD